MEVTCQCGAVTFTTPTPKPLALYHCHCTECRKQTASAYGSSAIFPAAGLFPLSANLSSKLGVWTRPTDSGGSMDCYFCRECGVRVMHRIKGPDGVERDTVSIKGGLLGGLDWKGAPHIYTRSAVVELPEGVDTWEGAPEGMVGRRQ
ncbi:hypothetical protein N657DRAFT_651048 [Parathielavia appendiculata]|uniref:CENP-V/GFA domain-containing protein n=1 Tax=Parathielavia appendiculata TaxID=2587402 RepID=A0AAN6TQD9_9PEZI|nr:hypothetical protein N657DRAFT_651048 [Parathielavia appendiculata]